MTIMPQTDSCKMQKLQEYRSQKKNQKEVENLMKPEIIESAVTQGEGQQYCFKKLPQG